MERDIEKDLIEIKAAIKENKRKDNTFTVSVLQRCSELVQELKEYRNMEEQGKLQKLQKLPCANWIEIVFGNQEIFWGIDMDYIENPIREITVDNSERMTWYDGWKTVVLKGADENGLDWEFSPAEIGKTVFLTKSKAEAALQKMNETGRGI